MGAAGQIERSRDRRGGAGQGAAIATDSAGDWSTNTSTVNVILTNNAYTYDQNGNLLFDGTRNFGYDDENELISVCVPNAWSNSFAYDGKMRRRIEQDYTWNAGTSGWQLTNEIHFIYDGNVVIEERDGDNNPIVAYTRGNDLSGTLQGAGGIGGLLARTHNGEEVSGSTLTNAFYHADGNGNVTCLIFQNQQVAAKYLYDPYGNTLAMSGPLATANKYRFSSKEWNDNSGLYYYLHRFYEPNLQRWVNPDPFADGVDPYMFVMDNPENKTDGLGLCPYNTCDTWHIDLIDMGSADVVLGLTVVHAQLTASPKCCMERYHAYQYNFAGIGVGLGLDRTFDLGLDGHDIKTPCIPWRKWNGPGKLLGAGAGFDKTWGTMFVLTPQAKFISSGTSLGIDLSIFQSLGFWHMYPDNGPGTQQE